MTTNSGYPPVISCFDWTLDRGCETGNPLTLSDGLRHHLIVRRYCNRVISLMSSNVSDQLSLPSANEYFLLLNLLEHDLDVIKVQLEADLSSIVYCVFLFH